jgi:hypothetical protein
MSLHVFVFLLVVCLFLSLALRCCLDWFHVRPSSSKSVAKRTRLDRLLKPRTPDDCPACACASLVRGQKPEGSTQTHRHSGVCLSQPPVSLLRDHRRSGPRSGGRWQAWPCRADPDVSRPCLSHHVQCSTRHPLVSPENPFAPGRCGALGSGRRARPFCSRAGLWLSTSHDYEVAGSRWPARSDLA